jgi:aminoglycoside phosphotransferase (APT) family kinase protein
MEMLCHLPRNGNCRSLAAVADELANRLRPFRAQFDQMAPDLLSRSLSCLDLNIAIPTILVHGDFVPWNILNDPKAGYVLVDWEGADFAGLPAYDLLHFQFSIDHLFGEKAGGYPAFRSSSVCADYFRRMDLDAELLPRLAIAYLLDQLRIYNKHLSPEHAAFLLRQLAAISGYSVRNC